MFTIENMPNDINLQTKISNVFGFVTSNKEFFVVGGYDGNYAAIVDNLDTQPFREVVPLVNLGDFDDVCYMYYDQTLEDFLKYYTAGDVSIMKIYDDSEQMDITLEF